MILKVITALVIFLLTIFSIAFIFENIPKKPVILKVNHLDPRSVENISYGDVPVFGEEMRFDHNFISYYIGENCGKNRRQNMIAAFNIFSEEVKVVSFHKGNINSDIKVECSEELIDLGNNLFTAGEGGQSRIINTSGFKVIEKGKIMLYNTEDCNYPIIALHELGHVFGFDHSPNPKNIMFNVSRCDQRMSDDMIEMMQKLYSIEALGDAKIDEVNAVIKGRYLDFNITVLNEGLVGIDNINLTILAEEEVVDVVDLREIEIGYGRTLRIENMRLPKNTKSIEFVLDAEGNIREIREDNNAIKMTI